MKVAFNQDETRWLEGRLSKMLEALQARRMPAKDIALLRAKFRGAGSYVFLKARERATVAHMASHVLSRLQATGGLESHTPLVQAILEKVS